MNSMIASLTSRWFTLGPGFNFSILGVVLGLVGLALFVAGMVWMYRHPGHPPHPGYYETPEMRQERRISDLEREINKLKSKEIL